MTAISSISTLATWVTMYAPGAPENLVADALVQAMRRFCIDSEILTEEIALTTVEDQADYTLTITTADCVIRRIEKVLYDDNDEADPEHEATYYLNLDDSTLTFETDYIPTTDDLDFTVTVVLVPEWRAETFQTWILERWGEQIAAGAAAAILKMKAYRDPDLAVERERFFLGGISEAKLEKDRKGVGRILGIEG